jgi:hypothetical protein
MKIVSVITEPNVIDAILRHLARTDIAKAATRESAGTARVRCARVGRARRTPWIAAVHGVD